MSRNAKNRMFEGKAQLHSVQMQLQQQLGEAAPPRPCGCIGKRRAPRQAFLMGWKGNQKALGYCIHNVALHFCGADVRRA